MYTFFGIFVCGPLWLTFVLYEFLGRRCFIDPICCNSCMVLSMFFRLVLANSLFFLCETSTWHLDSCPRKTRGMAWFCACSGSGFFFVRVLGRGLKSECTDIFLQSFLWLLRHTDEPQKGRNSCLWLQSRSVLSSFGVVLMSCRVNFHVVRSALQYSACRI